MFETQEYYEFRNYPKKWFGALQAKQITDELQVVIGSLNVPTVRESIVVPESRD